MPQNSNKDTVASPDLNLGQPIKTDEAARETLTSRSDHSYRFFDGVEIRNAVARQSLFYGVMFRNCTISDCDFSRSDFEGARFENCTLENVSFETADIRSTKFGNTTLRSCTFRSAVSVDNFFANSVLDDCEFEESSIFYCTFHNSTLCGLKNRASTWLHTAFKSSFLRKFNFSDCTSNYAIYDACEFHDVTINADAVGLTFGLTNENMKSLKFGFLGEIYGNTISPSIVDFASQYKKRNWRIHALIISINFSLGEIGILLISLLMEVKKQIEVELGAKKDDLEFIFRVMSLLKLRHRLPFKVAILAHDIFSELSFGGNRKISEDGIIEMGKQKSLYLANSMYEDLVISASPIFKLNLDNAIEAQITYISKPSASTLECIYDVAQAASLNVPAPRLLEARTGSWVEIIQMSLGSLFAFYVALYLANGCLAQLTMLRARSQKLVAKRLPRKFLRAASDPSHEMPKVYANILEKLILSQLSIPPEAAEAIAKISQEEAEGLAIEIRQVKS